MSNNVGDVVVLKSGGPLMTIKQINPDGKIVCEFFCLAIAGRMWTETSVFAPGLIREANPEEMKDIVWNRPDPAKLSRMPDLPTTKEG